MNRVRLTSLLLSPSLFSSTLSLLVSGAIVTVAAWSSLSPDHSFYSYLFGEYGLATILRNAANPLSAVHGMFDSQLAYNIAVLLFALFIGLLIYVFLEGIDHLSAEARGRVDEVDFITDAHIKAEVKHEVELRAGLRIATFLSWIVYSIFFLRVVMPFAIILAQSSPASLWSVKNMLGLAGSFALSLIAFHVHTIFLRLLFLRPRVFGTQNVVVGRGGHDE